jgi:hypothetical protein
VIQDLGFGIWDLGFGIWAGARRGPGSLGSGCKDGHQFVAFLDELEKPRWFYHARFRQQFEPLECFIRLPSGDLDHTVGKPAR